MSDEADISGKTYNYIYEEKNPGTPIFGIVSAPQFEEYVGKYRHSKSADPDGIPFREKKERYTDEKSVEYKEEDEFFPPEEGLHLIPEDREEKTVHKEVKKTAMEELIEEKLDGNTEIIPLQEKEIIHPIYDYVGKND